jgi:hypothetical protein
VWLYFRFHLSFRDVQDLLAERGVVVSHEAIRQLCMKFGAAFASGLRRRRARPGDKCPTRRSALKARTQAANQLHAIIQTAPNPRREQLRSLRLPELVKRGRRPCRCSPGEPAITQNVWPRRPPSRPCVGSARSMLHLDASTGIASIESTTNSAPTAGKSQIVRQRCLSWANG